MKICKQQSEGDMQAAERLFPRLHAKKMRHLPTMYITLQYQLEFKLHYNNNLNYSAIRIEVKQKRTL